jgi:acyl carrier protein
MERETRIHKIVEEVAKKPVVVDRDGSLFESGLLDSFALVDLVSALEQAFGIKIPDSDLVPQRFDSIAKIEQYLTARLPE